jgi:alpha-ketoglutarate-dependent taurine dioxygenase
MEDVEGLERQDGNDLIDELLAHCDQLQFQFSHKWQKGDMLIWDNRATQHQGTAGFDPTERRYLHRVMLQGEKPILAS